MPMFGKDQLVSGMWTGLTRYGALRLVSKHLIILQFLQNFVQPLHLVYYLGSTVRLVEVPGLHRDKTSVEDMGKHRNAAKSGRVMQNDTSPTPSSHGDELGDNSPGSDRRNSINGGSIITDGCISQDTL